MCRDDGDVDGMYLGGNQLRQRERGFERKATVVVDAPKDAYQYLAVGSFLGHDGDAAPARRGAETNNFRIRRVKLVVRRQFYRRRIPVRVVIIAIVVVIRDSSLPR